MGVGSILSRETGAGAGLVVGRNLSKEVEEGAGTDTGVGWVLRAVKVEEGHISGAVPGREGVLVRSIGVRVGAGLERFTDTKSAVVVDVGAVVVLERITGAGEEGLVVIRQGGDTVTWALDSPAVELKGL